MNIANASTDVTFRCSACGSAFRLTQSSNAKDTRKKESIPAAKDGTTKSGLIHRIRGKFDVIREKLNALEQHAKNKAEYRKLVLRAVNDGKLTDEEIKVLEKKRVELGMSDDDIRAMRVQAFKTAFASVSQRSITLKEIDELKRLQDYFQIPDDEISSASRELDRLRLLAEIKNGNLPTAFVTNVILQRDESAHWSEPAEIIEERVIRRRYEGGSHGVSFRIAKGISYRIGGHRGHVVSDRAFVPVSTGNLIITNRRVIFRGDTKSINLKIDKILDINLFQDGVRITDDKGKPRVIRFYEAKNTDIVGMVLAHVVNTFGA